MMKRFLGLFLAVTILFTISTTAVAAIGDTGFSDVGNGAWYAEAAVYCRDNGLMSGTSTGPAPAFSPGTAMSRAMLASILYRAAGSPAASASTEFLDVAAGAWYAGAVNWAVANGVILGYGNGRFGTTDPVTREQIAAILWRYDGSLAGERGSDFADESAIGSYAADAVDWVQASGIMTGKPGNRFDPKGSATRAEAAVILMNYMRKEDAEPAPAPELGSNILVAYFSVPESAGVDAVAQASRVVENDEVVGNVEFIARTIREETGADLFAIETVQEYPGTHDELLDFAAAEMDADARPALSTRIDNLDDYDVIFLGYPIWNADLPMPLYTFLDTYDLGGKTVIPFTAHGGSGFAGTISTIAAQEPRADVERNGFSVSRNSVADAKDDIIEWVQELGYTRAEAPAQPEPAPGGDVDVLVAYFSYTGNTEEVAERIAEYTGGDLAEIRRAQPYDDLYTEAEDEIRDGVHPAITVDVDDLDEYEVIFIGYPIWWDEAPAMIATFLAEKQDRRPLLHQRVQQHRQQPAHLPGTGSRSRTGERPDRQQPEPRSRVGGRGAGTGRLI